MATKATKKQRGKSKQAARQELEPPENEYRFDRLDEGEYDDCFKYEIERYRFPRLRARIREELASISADAETVVQPDDPEDSVLTRMRELNEQLNWLELEQHERPWLELSPAERAAVMGKTKRGVRRRGSDPVQLYSNLDVLGRIRLRLAEGADGDVEKLEITVDWTKLDEELTKSFSRLIAWMRGHRGKTAFKREKKRGRPEWPIELSLFALAVWRCSQCGMLFTETWDFLVDVRKKMQIGYRNKRTPDSLSRRIERLIT